MKKILSILSILILSTFSAKAEEGKFGFGVEGGYGFADIGADKTAAEIASVAGTTTYTYDKADLMGRLFVDYGVSQNINVELGYFRSAALDATYTVSGASASESYTVNGFDLTGVYKPSDEGFFGKAGLHRSTLDGSSTITIGGTTYNLATATATGTNFLVGAGYEGSLQDGMKWRAGVTYYNDVGDVSGADVTLVYAGIKF